MLNKSRRWRKALPHVLLLALILFSLRDVLALPGVIGHSWDWDVSAFPLQIWGRLSHDLFVWDYELRGGYYAPFRTGGLLSLFALPFSSLGGVLYSRLYIIIPMFLSALCMRRLASETLGLGAWWSTAAGALYMFSPVVFSRVMAGHNLLFPYALLPLLYVYVTRTVEGCAGDQFPIKDAVAAGLLLGLEAIHASMMVLALIVVAGVILFSLIVSTRRLRIALAALMVFGIFALLNAYWALPVGIGYTTSGTLYHSGSAIESPSESTAASVVTQRQNLFIETNQPMSDALRMNSFPGYGPEFTFPVPSLLATPWLVVSYLLPILAFGILLTGNGRRQHITILALTGLLGATLVTGATTPIGAFIAQFLMLHAFPIWAEFGNAVRAMPLLALAIASLVPASLERLSSRPGVFPAIAVASALVLAIYVSPFLGGSTMVDPNSQLALKSYQPSAEDEQVYEFLKRETDAFRISYVPPPWMYYPELYDLGYEWLGGLSPHPEFFVPYINPRAWRLPFQVNADELPTVSGKLLGLAAVKYLVYPRERFVKPAAGLFPASSTQPAGESSRARLIDQALENQKNWLPVTAPFSTTRLLENSSYMPRIYAATQASLVQGDSDGLVAVAGSSAVEGQPALVFEEQQDKAATQRLNSQVDRLIQTQQTAPAQWAETEAASIHYLLPFSPFEAQIRSFTASQEGNYAARVSAYPYRFVPAHPGDVTEGTFAPIDSRQPDGMSSNLLYDVSDVGELNSLLVTAYFPEEKVEDQYIELDVPVKRTNLVEYPNLHVNTQVDNTGNQSINVQLHLDVEGDDSEDVIWTSPPFSHGKLKPDDVYALQSVRTEFPGKERYHVVGVSVYFRRNLLPEWDRTVYPAGLYGFVLKELGLYDSSSNPGWTWQLPSDPPGSNVKTLSRSLEPLDPSRFPIQLEYQSDGPATLYVDLRLIARNKQGERTSLPMPGRLVAPFSQGTITIDARDLLVGASAEERLSAERVEAVVHRLYSNTELRPTTINLGRLGGRWQPSGKEALSPEPPVLTVNGKSIELQVIQSENGELVYSSSEFHLSHGLNHVSAKFTAPDTAYSISTVEIAPVSRAAQKKPPSITFDSINPTRWRVHVTDAQAAYWLVFSETFDPGWSAYIAPVAQDQAGHVDSHLWYEQSALLSWLFKTGTAREITDHYLVNGFANGWYVANTGNYDIVIEFGPQRMYEAGWIVSLFTLAASGAVLLIRRKE